MTSVSASHIILTPTQPAGSGRPQRESNPGPPHQESRALPTELPRPPYDGDDNDDVDGYDDHIGDGYNGDEYDNRDDDDDVDEDNSDDGGGGDGDSFCDGCDDNNAYVGGEKIGVVEGEGGRESWIILCGEDYHYSHLFQRKIDILKKFR